MFVPVLTVRLEGEEVVLKPGPSEEFALTRAQRAQPMQVFFLPAGFLSSCLTSSAGRLEKVSSSNGFHTACAAPFPAATALLWSCAASPGWAAPASGDLREQEKKQKGKEKNERMT